MWNELKYNYIYVYTHTYFKYVIYICTYIYILMLQFILPDYTMYSYTLIYSTQACTLGFKAHVRGPQPSYSSKSPPGLWPWLQMWVGGYNSRGLGEFAKKDKCIPDLHTLGVMKKVS